MPGLSFLDNRNLVNTPKVTINVIESKDRQLATAVNVGAIFFPYLAPIVGIAAFGKSQFVRFHAYRCLIEQVVMTIAIGFLMLCSVSYSLYGFYQQGFDFQKFDWVAFLIKSVVVWLLLGLFQVLNFINSVRDASEAFQGKVPSHPKWSERLAMKWAGFTNQVI
jgi:uncharacterized membrane protein